ncbi:MAG: hypothetical protein AAF990_05525, partial [Bacteroidota bacterium]
MLFRMLFTGCLLLSCLNISAQRNANPCGTPFHRQFDFWLGEWEVYHTQADTIVGYSHIKSILNGCVIEENWTGASGFMGKSFNTFNRMDSTWNQVWVDVTGVTYQFTGHFQDDVMDFYGSTQTPSGKTYFRLTFYHNPQ